MTNTKLRADSGTIQITGYPVQVRLHNLLPEDDPTYALIGRVAAEWARLEHKLDVMIWKMANIPSAIGSCITGQMIGHRPRFNTLGALGAILGLSDRLLGDLEQLANSTSGLADERNRIVHDAWFIDTGTGHIAQFRSVLPRRKTSGFVDIDDAVVRTLLSKITKRCDDITTMSNRIMDVLQASRKTRHERPPSSRHHQAP